MDNDLKQAIRHDMLSQRARLSLQDQQQASAQLAVRLELFLQAYFPAGHYVCDLGKLSQDRKIAGYNRKTGREQTKKLHIAVYAAMRQELNLSSCWDLLVSWPAALYFPAVVKIDTAETGQKPDKTSCLWLATLPDQTTPTDFLNPRTFGVPEPPPQACLNPANMPDLDLVLVPGLAFDHYGNRIGWGKAYYDRFLAALPPETLRIGIGYDFQLLDMELPHDAHDQRLHGILTPGGWIAATRIYK